MNHLQPVLFLYQFFTGLYIIQNTMVDGDGANGRREKFATKKSYISSDHPCTPSPAVIHQREKNNLKGSVGGGVMIEMLHFTSGFIF